MILSVVSMIHNRNDERRLNNLATTLWFQSISVHEWILVDSGSQHYTDGYYPFSRSLPGFLALHVGPKLKHLRCPLREFNKSKALNIGIKATSPESDYIMSTDIDMMFSTNFIETVLDRLSRGNRFVLCKAGYLPESADLTNPFFKWRSLCTIAEHKSKKMSPGAIQAAERDWWLKVHGYDERFSGGLGGMDDDMRVRAQRDGLMVEWIKFEEAQALHQWHEPSPMKGKTSRLFSTDAPVIANLEGWGEWTS